MSSIRSIASPLIILHKMPYSESSLIVRGYSRETGKVSFLVKGAKRPKSKFRGLLEYFTLYDARYRLKSGSDLHTLTEVAPIQSYSSIVSNLHKQALANVYLEIHLRCLLEPESSIPQFECSVNALETLNESARFPRHYPLLLCDFLLQFLHIMGLQPQFQGCVQCKTLLPTSHMKHTWTLEMGGPLCRSCKPQNTSQSMSLSTDSMHWLHQVQQMGTRSSVASAYLMKQAETLLIAFLQYHTGYRGTLKSLELYRSLIYRP
jgi:DNA repair protein RecO (recombination protein O)